MRAVFGVLMLLVVVAIVGVLAKKQLSSIPAPAPASATAPSASPTGAPVLQGTPQQQVQQFRNAVQDSMQQASPAQDDSQK